MIEQVAIAVFSLAAVYCSQDRRHIVRKYACLFGLANQPMWLHTTYMAGQWGIFFTCIIYTGMWMRGFYNNWIVKSV